MPSDCRDTIRDEMDKPEKPFWSAEEFYHLMIPNRLTPRSLNHKLREAGLVALEGRQRWKEVHYRHRNESWHSEYSFVMVI